MGSVLNNHTRALVLPGRTQLLLAANAGRTMEVSVERLERAKDRMMKIVAGRPDGEKFVTIFLRLEEEIVALKATKSDYERILQLASDFD